MATLSNGWRWLRNKARLVIEYALILAVVMLGSVTVATSAERARLIQTVRELSESLGGISQTLKQQVKDNLEQDQAIAKIAQLRDQDSQAIEGLQRDLADAQVKDQAIRRKLAQLEQHNAVTKSLIDTAAPEVEK